MLKLQNLKIGTRLRLGFGVLVLLTIAIGMTGIMGVRGQYQTVSASLRTELGLYVQVNAISKALGQLRRYEKDTLLNAGNVAKAEEYRKKWLDAGVDLVTATSKGKPLASNSAERLALGQIEADFTTYQKGAADVIAAVASGTIAAPTDGYAQMKPWREAAHRVEGTARQLDKLALDQVARLDDTMTRKRDSTVLWITLTIIAAVIVSMGVSMLIARSITTPLTMIQNALLRIARDHDLTVHLHTSSKDEVSLAAHSLNESQATLRETMGQIRAQAAQVNGYADRLAGVSALVTQRAEQQADATASSAASIEQMAVSVQSVSDNMGGVENQARQTLEQANTGAELAANTAQEVSTIAHAINETTVLIEGMDKRSAEIGGIIQVIKEIADQTNLLALNAAIEAARAGEQGRGFAVVADEVRKLAERTTQATNEIAARISTVQSETRMAASSMQQANGRIEQSVELAQRVAARFRDISAASTESSDKISDIAMALAEQTQASLTVSRNVETINQLSEQQSANAREATQLAEALRATAGQVDTLLAQFRMTS